MTFSKFTNLSSAVLLVSCVFWSSCGDKQSELEREINAIPIDMTVTRFDQEFFKSEDADLASIKKQYPYFFNENLSDEFWIKKKQDTIFIELNEEVEKKYQDLGELPKQLEDFFKHVKYYYPHETSKKKVITLISEVDVTAKAIYADSLALIALDTYLGKDHHFYVSFPEYLRPSFEPTQILPDLAESFVLQKIGGNRDRTFLGGMVQYGKVLYAKKLLLPKVNDAYIMGYTLEQMQWCQENEPEMWRYFIENNLLFDTDSKLSSRFLTAAPFSKYYLDIDGDSPGRTGAWLGWQIVNAYMQNNNVTLHDLFNTDAKEIFEKSKYKPKK
ncbi:gliding motility lipoprotein GldB [Myroides odoratimimus]|uniref:gliding motility lipoprotein GldB n=1 Tax=Myroides TaxID=76831 RepID=UPI0008F482DE|nr:MULTISPECIES: gliding motility lipoprotein GldB [Myroides]APA91427.1 gliding motility lipoprotein GldB [Myroides sp. ZB35]MEC4051514.1 gliding motility lipoprotein GldB [Myroides odoratimimus]